MNARIEKILVCLAIFLFVFSADGQSANQKEIILNVSITDARGRYAGGLKREDIQVVVDKKPQEISGFTGQNEPATIVFLIDLSGSQKESVAPVAKEIERFVKAGNSSNEYMILAFNTKIQMVSGKTADLKALEEALNKTVATEPRGNTAFYDSVYAAIDQAESGKYRKKVLITLSDGVDNASLFYKMNDVTESLRQSSVLFYGVNYVRKENDYHPMNLVQSDSLMKLAELSGGRAFFTLTEVELSAAFTLIDLELESHYQIAFRVADSTKPDKWREIKIKVAPVSDGDKKVKVQARARSGFYPASVQ